MYPKQHVLYGLILVVLLFLFFPTISIIGLGIIWASSVLIDFDHYTAYVIRKKDLSLNRAYRWFYKLGKKYIALSKEKRKTCHNPLCIFHNFESLIVIVILGRYISEYFYYVFFGMVFHLILDYYEEIRQGIEIGKISLFYNLIKFRKQKHIEDVK